jgi:PTS system glucose-specific IIA component
VALRVGSPVAGRLVGLAGVPDPVFAEAMVGPGTAIDPLPGPGEAAAPIAGSLVKLHPHAFVVVGDGGRGVLVHLGIDTVQLEGDGFELLAEEGARVEAGQPLIRWDPAVVASSGRSPICPVVALDAPKDALSELREDGPVAPGDPLFVWN